MEWFVWGSLSGVVEEIRARSIRAGVRARDTSGRDEERNEGGLRKKKVMEKREKTVVFIDIYSNLRIICVYVCDFRGDSYLLP